MNTLNKIPEENWFIQNYRYKSAIICRKVAGSVGMAIYDYLKFRKNFEGDIFYSLPKANFELKWGIDGQR